MLQSKLLGNTQKEWPNEATLKSHGLLIKGGYIKQMAAGIYTLMPLAKKVAFKIENIIREEMNSIGSQEILMPLVATKKLWNMSGRYDAINGELLKFEDRTGTKMVLSMTHEEAVVFMAMTEATSYQKYPFSVYQIQTKFRDEARSRGGLIRVREFTMKDAYSFHTTEESLDQTYQEYYDAYNRIYKRVGIPEVIAVASDTGMMGGSAAHEYMLLCDAGEDKIVVCKDCNYSANMEVAYTDKIDVFTKKEEPLEKIYTPGTKTIDTLQEYIKMPKESLIKAVIYTRIDTSEPVVVFIRADKDINETKLTNYLKTDIIPRKAEESDNITYGFVGPVRFHGDNATVIFDKSLQGEMSLVAGANEEDYHYKGINIKRDVGEVEYIDVSKINETDYCPKCHKKSLTISNGIEVGNIFKLGTKYSKSMGMTYLDENGKSQNPIMGCYGIGVGRLMASVLEARGDENATNWPASIAPFDIHILPIDYAKSDEIKEVADRLYEKLTCMGLDILLDDRNKNPGVKFADADLIGAPIKVIVSKRNLSNNVFEVKVLGDAQAKLISLDEIYDFIQMTRKELIK
ncbi:MAG: proline--tRNA ligase [Clostridia bacterium]|nr:proline--tRNA ligase [Clostridia bacterium]